VIALYTPAVPQSLAAALGMTHIRAVPDEAITLAVDVTPVWDAKVAAIHCHATQLSSSPIMRAPLAQQRLFLGREHFILTGRCGERDFFQELLGGHASV